MDMANKIKLASNGVKDSLLTEYSLSERTDAKKAVIAQLSIVKHDVKAYLATPEGSREAQRMYVELLKSSREYNKPEAVAERKRLKEEADAKSKAFNAMNPAQKTAYLNRERAKKNPRPKMTDEEKKAEEKKSKIASIEREIEGLRAKIEARREYYDFQQKKDYIEMFGSAEGFRPDRELYVGLVEYDMKDEFERIKELEDEWENLE